jgi:GT2 family glycosyltransferase
MFLIMDVSIIIVNYNTTDFLKDCLNSIIQYTSDIEFEIIVVDNNSPERIIEKFPEEFKEVNFFFRNVNDGFGAGCNYGASKAKGEYFIFVNPDIIFEENFLINFINILESRKEIGIISPLFKTFDNKIKYSFNKFPDITWEFYEFLGSGFNKRINSLLHKVEITSKSNNPLIVDWVTGACLFIRSELFKSLNGFDEKFFLYYEDVDLQLRAYKSGYKVACLPSVAVKHYQNSSISGIEGDNLYYVNIHRSKLLFMKKHFSFLKRNSVRALHIIGFLFRISLIKVRNRYKEVRNEKINQYRIILKLYLSNTI